MNGRRCCNNNNDNGNDIRDLGGEPQVVNIDRLAKMNNYYRIALWTGNDLQVTLMSIPVRGDIGLEMHDDLDQFIRIESGRALVMMGECNNALNYREQVDCNYAVIVPAGTWHNIVNIGNTPLKLYSVYAPPKHPFGTVHPTKEDAERAERSERSCMRGTDRRC